MCYILFFTEVTLKPGMRCASFDGDADRVVYYYGDKGIQHM